MKDEPDAWDECAACGHDRDYHDRAGCRASVLLRASASVAVDECRCLGFVEEQA